MKIEFDVPIKVRLEFNKKNNVFIGDSATGKTYLSKLVLKHSFLGIYNVLVVDYTITDEIVINAMVDATNEHSVLFIDNCDLLRKRGIDLYNIITRSRGINLIYVKNLSYIDYLKLKDISIQSLRFKNDILFNKEILKW